MPTPGKDGLQSHSFAHETQHVIASSEAPRAVLRMGKRTDCLLATPPPSPCYSTEPGITARTRFGTTKMHQKPRHAAHCMQPTDPGTWLDKASIRLLCAIPWSVFRSTRSPVKSSSCSSLCCRTGLRHDPPCRQIHTYGFPQSGVVGASLVRICRLDCARAHPGSLAYRHPGAALHFRPTWQTQRRSHCRFDNLHPTAVARRTETAHDYSAHHQTHHRRRHSTEASSSAPPPPFFERPCSRRDLPAPSSSVICSDVPLPPKTSLGPDGSREPLSKEAHHHRHSSVSPQFGCMLPRPMTGAHRF